MRTAGAVLMVFFLVARAWGDGMVVPEVYGEKVIIPDQRALIHFADGVEELVIETAFVGRGTNFGWIVPLPSAPTVKAVSEGFFPNLEKAFKSRLIHRVHRYYLGVLFLCGVIFLAWCSLKDEVAATVDLPLCLLIAGAAGVAGGHWVVAVLALGLVLYVRFCTRSPANFALVMLIGAALGAWIAYVPSIHDYGLLVYLGEETGNADAEEAGVKVVSVQHAGVFDSTTIRGESSRVLMDWFEKNGFEAPKSAEPAIRYYVSKGWVFVASKVRRESAAAGREALHPIAFTFATKSPVYPTRLTAVGNAQVAMELFVFGTQRAEVKNFETRRCDRIDRNRKEFSTTLRISDGEILERIAGATVGTRLLGRLTSAQMAEADTEILWRGFSRRRATVYSESAAALIALNVAVLLGAASWFLVSATRGGWDVTDKKIWRWRLQFLAASIVVGTVLYCALPKVAVVPVPARRYLGAGDELTNFNDSSIRISPVCSPSEVRET